MPDPVWPATLPQYPLRAGYSETQPDTVLETKMDAGPPKARQRFTAGERPLRFVVKVGTQALKNTLDDFVRLTLKGRALPFTWAGLDLSTGGGTGRYRITAPLQYTRDGATRWAASLQLMRLP